jgi:hypothetical protein
VDSNNVSMALTALVVPLVLAWLSRAGALASAKPGELRYGRVPRWFSLLMGLLPPLGVLFILMMQRRPLRPDERIAVLLLLLFFPGVCAPLVLEFYRVRHTFDQEGLMFRSPWSKHRRVTWSDVASLKWRRFAKWLDIRTHDGVIIHITPWLAGLRPFADVALARIPAVVLTTCPEGRAVLEIMSAGAGSALMTSPLTPDRIIATLPPRGGGPARPAS